ncbi:beta-N-acetylhexosaminidase [Spizellomyces sp. 'palustris']|nr:beta-N-acetylhexosaminidase [Spizellomyces sp. 'palustris']
MLSSIRQQFTTLGKHVNALPPRTRLYLHISFIICIVLILLAIILAVVLSRRNKGGDDNVFVTGIWPAARNGHVESGPGIAFDYLELSVPPTVSAASPCAGALLDGALTRLATRITNLTGTNIREPSRKTSVLTLSVVINNPQSCDWTLSTDESYSINVNNITRQASITSQTLLGTLRGFTTLTQLTTPCPPATPTSPKPTNKVCVPALDLSDSPSYPHRGVLLDTGRMFIPVAQILRHLDAMELVKLNTFHWHIMDAQSVPIAWDRMADGTGAFNGTDGKPLIYSEADIKQIVQTAYERGIRVVPEFDFPGHADVWARAYPEIMTCNPDPTGRNPSGQLNPFAPQTYSTLSSFFERIAPLFTNTDTIHLGMDEVHCECWGEAPGAPKPYDCKSAYSKIGGFLQSKAKSYTKNTMVWADPVVDYGLQGTDAVPKQTIVQVWKEEGDVKKVLDAGEDLRVVVSLMTPWYFDCGKYCNKTSPLTPMYMIANAKFPTDSRVIGGEAVLFSEDIAAGSPSVVEQIIWPRAAAVGESLWSNPRKDQLVTYERVQRVRALLDCAGIVSATADEVWT